MVRLLSVLSIACLATAVLLTILGAREHALLIAALVLVSLAIGAVLAVRSGYHRARQVVGDAHRFATGNIQHARLVEVGEPRGLLNPESTLVLELEGEDGAVHRLERALPVPFPVAWGYRLGRRFRLPLLREIELSRLFAVELRREGLEVELGRGPGAPPG